ncbi:hypothetical protein [Rhodothermus marinus]|uniref:hypothetical protein n=1 Tax=Rhodothermus marinus TaxID=29549 RepID=UPI000A41552A|nr:hypothetical protein [Rhodothermus marinus]
MLGLRVPAPALVQCGRRDPLFTLPEMERAVQILQEVYRRAGAPAHFQGLFYDEGHRFNQSMQEDAFAWLDRWLRG